MLFRNCSVPGLPAHRDLVNYQLDECISFAFINSHLFFWISDGLREFWVKATVLRLGAVDQSKQYCLSPASAGRVVLRGQAEKQEPQNYLQP